MSATTVSTCKTCAASIATSDLIDSTRSRTDGKLLQAHYAEAIPLDLLREEQERIRVALGQINERLASAERAYGIIETTLVAVLALLEESSGRYSQLARNFAAR